MDKTIEDRRGSFDICQRVSVFLPATPAFSWKYSDKARLRLHADFAGPFLGQQFFVIVDVHPKWIEVRRVTTTSATQAIAVLRILFATHGLCDVIVSDDSSTFT